MLTPEQQILPGTARKVIIMAYYYPPDNAAGAERPFRFARYLPCYGYSAEVISSAGAFDAEPQENVRRVPCNGNGRGPNAASRLARLVERYCLPYNERLSWVPHAVAAGCRLLQKAEAGTVLSTSPPIATHLAAMQLRECFGVKWVADFRDPLLGNPFRARRFARAYDAALERLIVSRADTVIANTENGAELWRERYPQWERKIHVIENGYDPEDRLGPAAVLERPYKVLVHVGNIYGGRDPRMLFASLGRLIGAGRIDAGKVRVRLVGTYDGAPDSTTAKLVSTLTQMGCLERTDPVPRQDARRIITEADRLLLIDTNARNERLQVPSKIFDYLRIGRPILALTAQDSPAEKILGNSGVPYRCLYPGASDHENDARLVEFLSLPHDPVKANAWFWERFDGKAQVKALSALLGNGRNCHGSRS